MLVDKQSGLMSDLLFTVHQHGGDDVTWKPPIVMTILLSKMVMMMMEITDSNDHMSNIKSRMEYSSTL